MKIHFECTHIQDRESLENMQKFILDFIISILAQKTSIFTDFYESKENLDSPSTAILFYEDLRMISIQESSLLYNMTNYKPHFCELAFNSDVKFWLSIFKCCRCFFYLMLSFIY